MLDHVTDLTGLRRGALGALLVTFAVALMGASRLGLHNPGLGAVASIAVFAGFGIPIGLRVLDRGFDLCERCGAPIAEAATTPTVTSTRRWTQRSWRCPNCQHTFRSDAQLHPTRTCTSAARQHR